MNILCYAFHIFRVLPETTIYGLREEVGRQIGYEIIPRDYVFLKSVGRCLTRVSLTLLFRVCVCVFCSSDNGMHWLQCMINFIKRHVSQ
jgi:hypothetical protein